MKCLNVNVGVLGHVDSGKTSLVEKLSTVLSTAALDKHPQSQERGITLDLGFSAFQVDSPEWLKPEYDKLQFTLVDCPGHSSLIKTVLGGAHIMDMMILVIDITKGIQLQTAECIVIGEIAVKKLVVVLNKMDLVRPDKAAKSVEKAVKRIEQTMKLTTFERTEAIIPVSAKTGEGVAEVVETLNGMVTEMPQRRDGPFRFAIDHCFRIKGQGTVVTGTVLQGSLRVKDQIEFPALQEIRRVKSIQMFKSAVDAVSAGDRAGMCVPNLDPGRIERGLAAAPGTVGAIKRFVASVAKVRFHVESVTSGQKMHLVIGYSTSSAKFTYFRPMLSTDQGFDVEKEFLLVEEMAVAEGEERVLAVVTCDQALITPMELPFVGARLDLAEAQSCRIAVHGNILQPLTDSDLQKLKVYKLKDRKGFIKQLLSDTTYICSGAFKKETDLSFFVGSAVVSGNGDQGKLVGPYKPDGDFLTKFRNPIPLQSQSDRSITVYSKKRIAV